MSDAITINLPDLYPDITLDQIYRGTVVDTGDPLQRGRVRIRVFGIHTGKTTQEINDFEGIPDNHLPWAEQVAPTMGGSSGFGCFTVPTLGSVVGLFFINGDPFHPAYFGTSMGMTGGGGGGGGEGNGEGGSNEETGPNEEENEEIPEYNGSLTVKFKPDLLYIDLSTVEGLKFMSYNSTSILEGMHPRFMQNLNDMAKDFGEKTGGQKISISDGWRNFATQQRLYQQNPANAAIPGKSNHGFGVAMDLNWNSNFEPLCKKYGIDAASFISGYGFCRPLLYSKKTGKLWEPWHIQLSGLDWTSYSEMKTDHDSKNGGRKPAGAYMSDSEKEPFKP